MDLKKRVFRCIEDPKDFITISSCLSSKKININGLCYGNPIELTLDVTQSIKLSKTIRTHINLIKEI